MAGTPTGLTLALLAEFASDMREARTINQLALSTDKAYANVHAAASALLKESILVKEVVGHSHRCRLNLHNDKTLIYLSLLETMKRDELLRDAPQERDLLRRIDRHSVPLRLLLAWRCKEHLLLVTDGEIPADHDALTQLDVRTVVMPLKEFLDDQSLRSTISGSATLLFGHALYASVLRSVSAAAQKDGPDKKAGRANDGRMEAFR